ncbi:MAG: glycosyltransferase [Rhodanobacteraceae bacterium]
MNTPLVSILVRSMDRPTLARALDSVARQDYPAIEVVVVAAAGAGHRPPPERAGAFPVRFVASRNPLKRAEAANVALESARGEWLNFLDDDDELLPDHVSTLRAALDAAPEARLAHSMSEDHVEGGGFLRRHGGRFKPWRQLDTGFFRPHCAMFASSLVDEDVRFDLRFEILEDMDFFIQCAQRTPFVFVDRATTRYYADAGDSGAGLGANRDEKRLQDAIGVLRSKWKSLETKLHATPEFRGEKASWLLDQGLLDEAAPLIAQLRAERPESVDALALETLMQIVRGNVAAARMGLDRIGDATPSLEAVATRISAVRARMASLG